MVESSRVELSQTYTQGDKSAHRTLSLGLENVEHSGKKGKEKIPKKVSDGATSERQVKCVPDAEKEPVY